MKEIAEFYKREITQTVLKLNVIKKQFSSVLSSVLIKEKIYFKVKKDLAVRQSLFLRKL